MKTLKTTKHTPGPWQALKNEGKRGFDIWAQSTPDADAFLAEVCGDLSVGGQNEANARLIAAAPELLEALQSAIGAIRRVTAFNIVPKLSDADLSRLACGEIGAQRSDEAKIGHVNTPFRDNAHGLKNSLSDIRGIIPALEAAIAKAERRAA